MALGTMPEEQVTEFRAGTVNDLLVAAKGGTTPAADDAKRWKSLAMGGGISSVLLAVALVVVLITGTGSKSSDKSASTTATTEAPIQAPPGTATYPIAVASSQVGSLHPGTHVTITGQNLNTDAPVTIDNAVVLSIFTETRPAVSKGALPTVNSTAQVDDPEGSGHGLHEHQPEDEADGRDHRLAGHDGPARHTAARELSRPRPCRRAEVRPSAG